MKERETLLSKLRAIDFALVELTLYLDTHPNCSQALDLYNDYRAQRLALADEYRCKFGPITKHDNNASTWEWICNPWPWDYEEGIC